MRIFGLRYPKGRVRAYQVWEALRPKSQEMIINHTREETSSMGVVDFGERGLWLQGECLSSRKKA